MLAQIGVTPARVVPADIDETPRADELPRDYAHRLAYEKAAAVEGEVVLAADTVVAAGRRILGKPANADEARSFLDLLSGRRHRVMTAVAVKSDEIRTRVVITQVKLKRLSADEITGYIASGEWKGKAGGYAIQGIAGAFVPWINGSYTAVVGLPLTESAGMLQAAGVPLQFDGGA